MNFWTKVARRAQALGGSLLCVGLDPAKERIPERFESVAAFLCWIVDETLGDACAYKPNMAFFEALGDEGQVALRAVLEHIPDDVPVILDAKRNDIGTTAAAYARAVFDVWGVDAVTVNPYLGRDGVAPFCDYADRGVFVLCKTSNPSGGEVQDWAQNGVPLYRRVADLAYAWAPEGNLGLVVGATYPEMLAELRAEHPEMWFLVPGVGAQGGDLDATLRAGLRDDGLGLLVNSSRGIIYAASPRGEAKKLADRMRAYDGRVPDSRSEADRRAARLLPLCRSLHDLGCVRFGDFTLHSGAWSPVYVDLRLLVSAPKVLEAAASAYAEVLSGLSYDRVAAVPHAGLPIGTAVCLRTGDPLLYPRREAKAYGTRRAVEGAFEAGERVVLLDDLISSGGSKLEAIEVLEDEGLTVEDVAVLIDREQGGREDLAERGYRLHAVLTLRELVAILVQDGRLDDELAERVTDYLRGTAP